MRVVNVAPKTGAIDVYRATALGAPLFSNVAFRDRTAFAPVPPGTIDLLGVPAGSTALQFLFIKEFGVVQGGSSSVYVMGNPGYGDHAVLPDSTRSIPTQGAFRFLLAAPSQSGLTAGLDIYVTTPGLTLDFTAATSATTDDAAQFKRATALQYQGSNDYTAYKPDTYEVRVMTGGTTTVLLDTTITLPAGGVETYVVNDDPDTRGAGADPDRRRGALTGRAYARSGRIRSKTGRDDGRGGGGRYARSGLREAFFAAASVPAAARAARSCTRRKTNKRRPTGVRLRVGVTRWGGAEVCCVFGVHQDIPRMRAASRLLCRAALLRWTICLLTMLSMIGTATA